MHDEYFGPFCRHGTNIVFDNPLCRVCFRVVFCKCDGNKFTVDGYSATDDIAGYAADQRESCAELIEEYNSGMMLDDEDDEW